MMSSNWQWAPSIYIGALLLMNILSTPFSTSEMPDDCPEDSFNCEYVTIALNVSDEELHQAMFEWQETRGFTTTFSEGHIVDRTSFFQFPDDVHYSNECGTVEIFSKSRLGRSDMGVNMDRIQSIIDFLDEYEFQNKCQ